MAIPPSREEVPATPRAWIIGFVARGKAKPVRDLATWAAANALAAYTTLGCQLRTKYNE